MHGRIRDYRRGCRCEQCRNANATYMAAQRAKRKQKRITDGIPATVKHGASAYSNWGCRCTVCVAAFAVANGPAVKRYQAVHADRIKSRQKALRAARPEVARGYVRRYRAAHPDRTKKFRAAQQAKQQARTLERAKRWGYQWTGPELELAARTDLTARQVAAMTGRTYYAVRTIRTKLRQDPKIINLAGVSRALAQDRR